MNRTKYSSDLTEQEWLHLKDLCRPQNSADAREQLRFAKF